MASYWCADCDTIHKDDVPNEHANHTTWRRVNVTVAYRCAEEGCSWTGDDRRGHFDDEGHNLFQTLSRLEDADETPETSFQAVKEELDNREPLQRHERPPEEPEDTTVEEVTTFHEVQAMSSEGGEDQGA